MKECDMTPPPLSDLGDHDVFRLGNHLKGKRISTEAQINRYFRTKGLRVGLPRHKARRGNPLWLPLVASIKIPQNLGFST